MPKLKKNSKSYYDWDELLEAVKAKSGKDPDDWAGSRANEPTKQDYKTGNYPIAKWAVAQGWDWTVLNDPVDAAGMAERVRIRQAWDSSSDKPPEIPWQSFWHYAESEIFYGDVDNGNTYYFNPVEALENVDDEDDEGESQEWIREILRCMIDLFHENKMPDQIEVMISW